MPQTPNRALARATLETLAWRVTPADYRGGSGSRREVLVNSADGTTLTALSDLTDNQLRKYIGPQALEEAGDMRKNGRTAKKVWIDNGVNRPRPGIELERYDADGETWARVEIRDSTGKRSKEILVKASDLRSDDAGSRNSRTHEQIHGHRAPKFRIGDRVEDNEGKRRGKVGYIGAWQGEEYGGYSMKVDREDGGPRLFVPENAFHKVGHSQNSSRGVYADITPSPGDYVILPQGDRYRVERVEEGGSRLKLGGLGYPSLSLCRVAISADRDRHGERDLDGFIFEVVDGELREMDDNDPRFQGHSPNARAREEADETAARELSLYIENEYDLIGAPNSQGKAIEKNLLAKIRNGTFDLAKSELAWMYLMETGAKKYAKEMGSGEREWSRMFNKPTRELVAHEFATTFYDEHKGALSKNGIVEDGDYFISGAYSDGKICESFGFDGTEEAAIREARKMLRSPTFEGDSVRVITRDGELVFQS